jgi:hypothetical protein
MIKVLVYLKGDHKLVSVYHRWDIDNEEDIVGIEATKEDIGKFFDFKDGSGWYGKIRGVNDIAIRTNMCVVRKKDYVHQSHIRFPHTNYSGVMRTEEHELVRPFTRTEKGLTGCLLKGKRLKYLSERVKMLTMKKLQEGLKDNGINEDEILDLLKNAARKGNEKIKAITILARIGGVELEAPKTVSQPLLNVNNNFTIQDRRRNPELTPTPSDKAIIDVVAKVVGQNKKV